MKVQRILAAKSAAVVTIRADDSIRSALALLARHNFGALVVVNEVGRIVGILSERDIVRQAARDENLFSLPVSAVMTDRVIVGVPQDDVMSVAHTMTESRFRHLPIVDDDGVPIGMISIGDVLKAQRDAFRGEIETLETQIMAEADDV